MSCSRIYFCGSIRGGRDDRHLYIKLIDHLKKYGTVLTEHIGSDQATDPPENIPNGKDDIFWAYTVTMSDNSIV